MGLISHCPASFHSKLYSHHLPIHPILDRKFQTLHLAQQPDRSQRQPHRANQKCHNQQNHTILRGIGNQHSHAKQSNYRAEQTKHQTGYVDQPHAEPDKKRQHQNDRCSYNHQQPFQNLYVAASSAMDLFDGIGALEQVRMTSTTEKNWSLPHIQAALEQGTMLYVGKYSAPDYETILSQGCNLAIESTMIYHSPEIQEKLETLGIPVLVERSSYESHPLGRMEWMKLYGLLLNRETEADAYFTAQSEKLDSILTEKNTGKTVAFFYITTNGSVNIRKPGDYTSKMIELAGGNYLFSAEDLNVEENALSTMNIQMETFYAVAKDADYLIYNSTIDGDIPNMEQFLQKSPLLADLKAVKEQHVWCTKQNLFQQTTGAADMIADFHEIVTGAADGKDQLTYLHRIS